jgi:hypothetical protein
VLVLSSALRTAVGASSNSLDADLNIDVIAPWLQSGHVLGALRIRKKLLCSHQCKIRQFDGFHLAGRIGDVTCTGCALELAAFRLGAAPRNAASGGQRRHGFVCDSGAHAQHAIEFRDENRAVAGLARFRCPDYGPYNIFDLMRGHRDLNLNHG